LGRFYFKKIFLITNIYDKLKIIDIFNFKKSFIYQYDQIDGFEQYLGDNGCIIQNKKNNDYLYLGDNKGQLNIINLRNRQIIEQIKIKINKYITFIENWNDKYIIIGDIHYIYVFNTDINKIISKYLSIFNSERIIHHIIKFFYVEYNFYCLCVNGNDNIIRIFY